MKKYFYTIAFLFILISLSAQQADLEKIFNQAQMASELGYIDDAIDKYNQILKVNPRFARAYLELGNNYLKKGQDVNSIENAIKYFTQYLQLNPDSDESIKVKATLDKLEFILEKSLEKERNRELIQGRWASVDGNSHEYGWSSFIFDITEFDNKKRIDIEPSSLIYSNNFIHKTVYVDENEHYIFTFTNDVNYVPDYDVYDTPRDMIYNTTSVLGTTGQLLGALFDVAINTQQAQDIAKRTIFTYDFKLSSIPDEDGELNCIVRMLVKVITQAGEKVVKDEAYETNFCKVNSNYYNISPLKWKGNLIYERGGLADKNILKKNENEDIAHLFKTGKLQRNWGFGLMIVGLSAVPVGIAQWIVAADGKNNTIYNSQPDKELIKAGQIMAFSGIGLGSIGFIMRSSGIKNTKKSINLYNNELFEQVKDRKAVSEFKIGFTNDGFGLTYTF